MEISPFLVPIVFFISLPVTIIGVMLTRAHMRQVELRGSRTELSPELSARLDRMEQAMEAIAVEVERVGRLGFTTKLLAERGGTTAGGENNPKGGTPWTKT